MTNFRNICRTELLSLTKRSICLPRRDGGFAVMGKCIGRIMHDAPIIVGKALVLRVDIPRVLLEVMLLEISEDTRTDWFVDSDDRLLDSARYFRCEP